MRPRLVALVAVLAVLTGALAACSDDDDRDESLLGPAGASPSAALASASATPADLPRTAADLFDQMAASVRDHDRVRFLALLGGDEDFRADQARLFANLQRLPVSRISFAADGDGAVDRSLDLGTYDDEPVVGPAGFRVARQGGRAVAVPDPDRPGTEPWDLAAVRVAASADALVVTDVADADRLRETLAATDAAIAAVDEVIPLAWSRTAVVYAFRDPAVVASYARVPGGNLQHLGALTYPVRDRDGARTGSRVALLPGALDADGAELGRILRHEVTHVAIGAEDDDVPTWLTEGLAEHVAAQAVPVQQRRIATVAVDRARAGAVTLPDAASFNGDDQALHYAEAWMACDYLADAQGDAEPWDLLAAMHDAKVGQDGTDGPGQDAVLRQVTGLDTAQLADRTADRIRRLFG